MHIKKIKIQNYRGIKNIEEIPLSKFSSIVGKNDSGKSIVLNAIATFLDVKSYPIVESDFNDLANPIFIECHFEDDNLKEFLETKIKIKIKKNDGLDEFLDDILFDNTLIIQKIITKIGKSIKEENILIKDFDDEDFSMIYSKSDEELNKVLQKYSIVVPVEGKGRNSKLEKIKFIKEYCNINNIPSMIKSISDDYKVSSLLPDVELFVSDYGLKADTSFKSNSVSEIQDYFVRETDDDTKRLKQIEKEIQSEMNIEAVSIKNYMLDYTSSLQKVEITPNIVWKDAIKSVDVSFQFDDDSKLIPMSHKGSGYRRLFMVARFRYLAEKNKGQNVIYLIEEPETFLHPSAQEDLLNSLRDLSEDNQIIITTHSPVFTGSTNYKSVILSKKVNQSIYESAEDDKIEFIAKIVKELGIKPHYNLVDNFDKIVFVESKNDAIFYDILSSKILEKHIFENEKILILPFGGDNIDGFINIEYFNNSGRELFLIIDSDKHQSVEKQEMQKQRVDEFNKKDKGKAYLLKKSCIENYYHPRAIERFYSIDTHLLDYFEDNENVKETLKQINTQHKIQIKTKNNFDIFNEMTKEEWKEIAEEELISFVKLL